MKKTVSVVIVLVMLLALGAVAYADYGILVTKHPTDETRAEGETAWFVSGAQYYNTLDWTFVGPSGREYNVKEFRTMFPYVTVEGTKGGSPIAASVVNAIMYILDNRR